MAPEQPRDPNLPDSWNAQTDTWGAPPEYNPKGQPLLRYEHDTVHLWIEVARRDPNEGLPRDIPHFTFDIGYNVDSKDDFPSVDPGRKGKLRNGIEKGATVSEAFSNARTAARYFTHEFEENYEETGDAYEACEYAQEQIEVLC